MSTPSIKANPWKVGDRVSVSPTHYGTGLQKKVGTVLRITPTGLVEVLMDSGKTDVVAFWPKDLRQATKSKRKPQKKVYPQVGDTDCELVVDELVDWEQSP